MIHAALPVLAATSLFALTSEVKLQKARSGPTDIAVHEGVEAPHDFSWYPFDERPPFVSELVERDGGDVVYAGNAVFTVDDPPRIPTALEKPLRRGDVFEPGYFVVHFEGGVRSADKAALDQLTGRVQRADGSALARWYVPNHALIAWVADETVYTRLRESLRVDWIGRYQPAWKLDPTIGSFALSSPERIGRSFYRLNVDLVPGHNPTAVAVEIGTLGGVVLEHVYLRGAKTYDVSFLVVDASPETVVEIAGIEGVRMIQETGDGKRVYDLSGGGKLQNRTLSADDQSASPIVTSSAFPLWLNHDLQGQGQLIGVVDTSIDWNNTGTSGCGFGFPDTAIDNWGFALPNLSKVLLSSVGTGGVNLKVPRAAILGGATLQGNAGQHGSAAAGAALADFYGNNDTKWWEHDVDTWESWSPSNYSGLLGPGIAHEAQLFFAPTDNSSGAFRWEFVGEFETNMNTALDQMAAAGTCTTNHSVGIVEAMNTYTQVSVTHDTNAFDHQDMLQCMAAGNDGAGANKLSSQAVVKNALTVGASDDVLLAENRVSFSSTGPRFDGGQKPDVLAPGSDSAGRTGGVQSLLILPESNGTGSGSCAYQYTAGTSFASPIAAGAGALIHQYFEEGRYSGDTPITDASAALMKAMLVAGGHRLTGANLGDGNYPNMYQGWGEPNLSDVLDFGTGTLRLAAYDVASGSGFTGSGNANDDYDITVNGSGERLRVALVWTDEPGSAGSGKKLINDLDLRVVSPSGTTYRGNVINGSTGLSTSGGSADTLNNIECVLLASPQTGTWTVTVDPGAGNYSVGQGYALVVTGDITEGGGTPPPPPVADFSGAPTSGTYPLTVNFSDLSTGSVSSWSWDFGDSTNSTAQNPSHTYTAAGTYTVSLTATGPGGADTETKVGYITVADPAPVAEFSGSPTSGVTPLAVSFTDLSSGPVTSWSWNFGDSGTSTAQNPNHTYNAAGTYTVSLTVTGPGGSDVETKVDYITVSDTPTPPVADFSASPTSGDAPLAVNFTDLSTGSVTSWSWNFGDSGTSTAQNPSHTYTSAGSYTVTLTATGPGGSDVETKTGYITVSDPPAGGALYYISFLSNTSVPGLGTVADEDVVTYDPATDTWAWYFDGSDVGITTDINALHVLTDGTLVFSLNGATSVPGLTGGPSGTNVDDSDLMLFNFTQTGSNTAGTPQFIFDGSDVGLTTNGEDIDGVYEFPGGGLGISTLGSAGVSGVSGVRDEDILFFAATQFGSVTTGTWSMHFDGSDVGFANSSGEDLNAITFDNGADLIFSTAGTYTASGASGADEDVSRFSGTFGPATSGSATLILDLSALGIDTSEDIDAIFYRP